MNRQPTVSIALCTYNGEAFLPAQLDSLLAQDGVELEVVAVDDCSTDGSWSVLQDYARREPRLRVFRNDVNLGFVANFERALGLCRGQYVAPSDQDDVWRPEKLATLIAAIGSRSAAYCNAALVDAQGRPLGRNTADTRNMYSGNDPAVFVFRNCVSGHGMLFRRELLEAALPFPPVRFHDWWLAFVAASRDGIVYVDQPLVQFRQHAGSRTDMGRQKGRRGVDRLAAYEETVRWLRCLSALDSPHRAYFVALSSAWEDLTRRMFSLRLFRLMIERRQALFYIDGRSPTRQLRQTLRSCIGWPLRRLFNPRGYRAPVLPG